MIKKILIYTVLSLLLLYVVVSFIFSSSAVEGEKIVKLRVEVCDSSETSLASEVEDYLISKGGDLVGHPRGSIDYDSIEHLAESHPLIKRAECYVSPEGDVVVNVWRRVPIVRVFAYDGKSFYIGDAGEKIDLYDGSVPYVPVLTGYVDYASVKDSLFGFLSYIYNDTFWKSQIEQINVASKGEIEIVPRVGQMRISLGDGSDYIRKLDNVKLFYREALDVVGWNKYKRLNVEFVDQIIAEK